MASKDLFQPGADTRQTWTPLETATLEAANVGWHNASAPFKKYLLIRDGDFLCAVRFVNYVRGQDKSAGSIWSSGDETLTSAYEWNVLEQRGTRVEQKAHGQDIVRFTAPSGIGRFVIAGGYDNIKCGDRKFGWQYPAGVNFSQRPESGMRLAPTRWESISDIRLDDPKLVWYSFDSKRQELRIPLRAL